MMTPQSTIKALAAAFNFDETEATEYIRTECIRELDAILHPTEEAPAAPAPAAAAPAPASRAQQPAVAPTEPAKAAKAPKAPKAPKSPKAPKKTKLARPAMQLPFCGIQLPDRCSAVGKNYGLYTQCMNPRGAPPSEGGVGLCATCIKNSVADNTPKFGFIEARLVQGDAWADVDGKAPVPYVTFWEKKLADVHTRTEIEAEAAKFGLKVPASAWVKPEKPKTKRARKVRTAAVPSSDSGSDGGGAAAAASSVPRPRPRVPRRSSAEAAAPAVPDLVSQAAELQPAAYEAETEDEEFRDVKVQIAKVDLGSGPTEALVDTDGKVYCYETHLLDGVVKRIGTLAAGVYTPL